jgi:hypothetical protein
MNSAICQKRRNNLATSAHTATGSATSSFTKVVEVTRQVQADFLQILDTYGYFAESYAQQIISDVRIFLDEEALDTIRFIWLRRNTNYVLDELLYTVIANGVGLANDRPGGIGYRSDLVSADFRVRITYSSWWQSSLPQSEKQTILDRLSLSWGPAGQLDYSGGKWTVDRTYSPDGEYGLTRSRFTR